MRKLSGAKDKLALRVHGLIVGSPEKKRADPAVLRALCSNPLPSGRIETLITEFAGWASVSRPFCWMIAEAAAAGVHGSQSCWLPFWQLALTTGACCSLVGPGSGSQDWLPRPV